MRGGDGNDRKWGKVGKEGTWRAMRDSAERRESTPCTIYEYQLKATQ